MVEFGTPNQQSSTRQSDGGMRPNIGTCPPPISINTDAVAERLRQAIVSQNIEENIKDVKTMLDQQADLGNRDAILASTYKDESNEEVHGHRLIHWATDSLYLVANGVGPPSLQIVRMLLDFGFCPNDRGANGDTALNCIVRVSSKESVEITKELIVRGANVNLQNMSGCTALHEAAVSHSCECLNILLSIRINPSLKNHEGLTARESALQAFSGGSWNAREERDYRYVLRKLSKTRTFSKRKAHHGHKGYRYPVGPRAAEYNDEERISLLPTPPPSYDPRMDFDLFSDFKSFFLPYGGPTNKADPIRMNVCDMIYKNGLSDKCTTRHKVWFHLPLNNVGFAPNLKICYWFGVHNSN